MSKRYRGRYLTTRLCKRSLNSSDPPKGCYYSIRQLTKGASLAKDLTTVTGSIKKTRSIKVQIPQNQHHGGVFTSQLSSPSLLSSSLLKHLSSENRGVVEELILSDLSTRRTNQPQSCASLPGSHWKRSLLNCPSLSALLVGSIQTIPRTFSPEPQWVCVTPDRFYDLFYGPYFLLRRSWGLLCGPVIVGTRKGRLHSLDDRYTLRNAVSRHAQRKINNDNSKSAHAKETPTCPAFNRQVLNKSRQRFKSYQGFFCI
ncbi:hypothetical protein AVEN_80328-1 [Araneus ventricosus]|uniref:Uncharacterized protein n=1 Tax=Araneus ventricosus TaxID=182803 RepID=A0A4Y2V9Q4_ARAVE|nr:hypothetical protein AVEN_80328-1 [Araneus ventricosus]